jgi:hypothetical protein
MITVLGNVNNAGFALPMVSAAPLDINAQYVLGWNPALQALDYIPFVVGATGDIGVARDLSVVRNALIGGTLGVTGVATFAAKPVFTQGMDSLTVNNAVAANGLITASGTVQGLTLKAVSGAANAELLNNQLNIQGIKVVAARDTGWTAMTGTPQKTTAATGTVTLAQLAGIVMAMQTALINHGLIGA